MITDFQANRQAFEVLKEAVRAESARTGARAVWTQDEAPNARISVLLAKLGVEEVSGTSNYVALTVESSGLGISGGSLKAYEWRRVPPDLVLESLDPPLDKRGYRTSTWWQAYRRIEPEWYLSYSRS